MTPLVLALLAVVCVGAAGFALVPSMLGSSRVDKRIKALQGDVIVTQDIFLYDILGEDSQGNLMGRHRSTGITKPQFTERARYFNEEPNLVEALEKSNVEHHEILGA